MKDSIKRVEAKDLVKNIELLSRMHQFVSKNYFNIDIEQFPLANFIKSISSNNMFKVIFYIENNESEIISYLECEELVFGKYYISQVTTNKMYRNKGYARYLLFNVIHFLDNISFSEITIHINKKKPYLFKFYSDIGFKQKSSNDNYDEATYCYYNDKNNSL